MNQLLRTTALVGALAALASPAWASKPLETRMLTAEKRDLNVDIPIQTSSSNPSPTLNVFTPTKGWITGLACVNNGATTQGASATVVLATIGSTSLKGVSLSIISGTLNGQVVSITVPISNTNLVALGSAVGISVTGPASAPASGGQTVGGQANCNLEITPDYY